MDFGIAFALGLLGSLHCAAMCGPLMLALPVAPGGTGRFVVGRIIYQLGRVMTYCLLGVVAGLIGKSIFLAGLQRWLSISLGVAILLGFLVSKKISVSTPVVRLVTGLKTAMSAQLRQRSLRSLALLGMLNGLLPCGLVYVAMAGAVSRGTLLNAVLHGIFRPRHAADDAGHQPFGKIISARIAFEIAQHNSGWRVSAGRAADFAWTGAGDSLRQPCAGGGRAGQLLCALNLAGALTHSNLTGQGTDNKLCPQC